MVQGVCPSAYTNATTIIDSEFVDTEQGAGLFSGYNSETRKYDASKGNWAIRLGRRKRGARERESAPSTGEQQLEQWALLRRRGVGA